MPLTAGYSRKFAEKNKSPLVFAVLMFLLFAWCAAPDYSLADNPRSLYLQAQKCARELKSDPRKRKYRDRWIICIQGYQKVYKTDPNGPWAAAGLYEAAVLYEELYQLSHKKTDRAEAVDLCQRIVKRFPKSAYKSKAIDMLAEINQIRSLKKQTLVKNMPKIKPLPSQKPKPKPKREPKPEPKPEPQPDPDPIGKLVQSASCEEPPPDPIAGAGDTALVTGLRYWSSKSYTRVVIDADKETQYKDHLLKKDPALGKPQRLFIDMDHSKVGKDLDRAVTIQDDLLSGVRAAQFDQETVRVVVDLKSFKSYKVFSLKNPFRVVIDVRGEKKTPSEPVRVAASRPALPMPDEKGKVPAGAIATQLALGVSTIVIDAGHGGKDYGAPGAVKGVHEKQVVLAIAQKLAKALKEQTPCQIYLTRDSDRYLTLEERTAIANTKNADLFISIHTNSHPSSKPYGVETYYLNLATDDESIRVAALENQTSKKNISDLQSILDSLMHNNKVNESQRLAHSVQKKMCSNLKTKYSAIRDRGVRKAPFYVLLGAEMPAILVETSFISNSRECKRLTYGPYQDRLVQGIVDGVKEYVKQLNPTTTGWTGNQTKTSG
ncbi:N-acetylmuramoyl-L-alanine amidase [Desulfatibacillum aliphaticivorans]|uniref:N-acetylmuramoyl-L-alanine amidase n=1 Tax=Desulfatibacillum aliphaticivorans TaxID=218208 RepID=UPI0005568312|nr:N-acetylmuramoyl-L-alanine amidase [Desulfatibacillum aliphaticivorans]